MNQQVQDNERQAIVYIDGLNLYYGAVKDTPYKWLDLERLCRRLLPEYDLKGIKYFTSRILSFPDDPRAPQRQDIYFRALATLDPLLSTYLGKMKPNKEYKRLVNPPAQGPKGAVVYITEEKQTDIKLAIHLLWDAFNSCCDTAVVITNDSDLFPAIEMVENSTNTNVILVNPSYKTRRARDLRASEYRQIRKGTLADSQFPLEMEDDNGIFRKPQEW